MREICISRRAQTLGALAVLGAAGALVAAELPGIQRYLKIRMM